tara:strand:+ start:72256 stop:72591 length:336 start_codon:yes stop_codon:yes gene_type:complete
MELNRQDYYNIITKIFKYDELTVANNWKCILNKWHPYKQQVHINNKISWDLIYLNILELDGGNFETGERHYILNKSKLSELLSDNSFMDFFPNIDMLVPLYREMILNEVLN